MTVVLETYAAKNWKPLLIASSNRTSKIGSYKDNGGVCYAGLCATRTGQTHASPDIIIVQAATDVPLGIVVEIQHADNTDWDFDEVAADNDVVKVAALGSGHVVAAYVQSAQGDLEEGQLLRADALGMLVPVAVAAAAGDSVDVAQQSAGRVIGRLYEDCLQSTADPKKDVLAKVILRV